MANVVTVEEARMLMPTLSSGIEDVAIARVLARADAVLALRCGFGRDDAATPAPPSFTSQSYTFFLNTDNVLESGRVLQLPVYPVTAITKIESDATEVFDGATYVVQATDYRLLPGKGKVLLLPTARQGAWYDTDERTQKAVFVAGWTDATMPEDIKRAISLQVGIWFQTRAAVAVSSLNFGGSASATMKETAQDISPDVMRILSARRCWRALT